MAKQIKVKLKVDPDSYPGAAFAQIALVNVTDTEATFDFAYLHPSKLLKISEADAGKVLEQRAYIVSRVVMPIEQAKQFASSVLQTLEKHNAKIKK
jgi:hypothetical protein